MRDPNRADTEYLAVCVTQAVDSISNTVAYNNLN